MEDDQVLNILLEVKSDVAEIKGELKTYSATQEKLSATADCVKETEARSKSNTHRIDKIEANLTWLWRTIAGALIIAAIAAYVSFV